jgi:hypothetical protein
MEIGSDTALGRGGVPCGAIYLVCGVTLASIYKV